MKGKGTLKLVSFPVIVASLCCLAPIILVLFGLGSISLAGSLSDSLYGDQKWIFRIAGLILLSLSLFYYLRNEKGICTIDDVKKRRNEIINIIIITTTVGIIGYILFLYVFLGYIGKWLNIW